METLRILQESLGPVRRQLTAHRLREVGDHLAATPSAGVTGTDTDDQGALDAIGNALSDALGEAAGWVADTVGNLLDLL